MARARPASAAVLTRDTRQPPEPDVFPTVGRWISAPAPSDADRFRAPVLSTTVSVPTPLASAVLHVCGLGLQHVTVDGAPIDDRRLDPPFTNYDERLLYTSHDVMAVLPPGEHRLDIELGRGFFAMPTENVWHWERPPWRGPLRALAELHLVHPDGTTTIIGTDESWEATLGRTTFDCYQAGESYDATLAIPAPVPARGAPAPKGLLHPARHEPIRVTWRSGPLEWERVGDAWVADVGRTIAGWIGLRTHQAFGAEVTIKTFEHREPDGTVAPHNRPFIATDRFQTDTYVGDGTADQYWEPRFTYKGFRFVQLEGLTHAPGPDTVVALAAHNDVRTIGEFRCSDPLLERYVIAMERTIRNNLHHIPTDTPAYEKNGWTGDAHVAAVSMLSLLDLRSLFTKWLDDIRDAQLDDGALPVIAPTGGWGYTDLAPSPEWTTVYPHLLRELYRRYGDLGIVREHWDALTRYLDWELARLVDGLAVSELGDWLQPGTSGLPADDTRFTATGMLIGALRDTAFLGRLIDRQEDGARFETAAAALGQAVEARFLDRDAAAYAVGEVFSQTSNALALELAIVPPDLVAAVADRLAADVVARDEHLNVGCIGAAILLRVLTAHGRGELAYRVATNPTYPGWGYWFANGAETMWEQWELATRSTDHYFMGTIVQWLFEDIAGVRCGDDGWRTFQVRPHPVGGLTHASYSVQTVRGRVAAQWVREADALVLTVTVPPGSTATVTLPGRSTDIVASEGVHEFRTSVTTS